MPNILYVEDERAMGAGFKEYLEEFKDNYQVTWLDRGDSAYDMLLQPLHAFDCILIDLTLPGKYGLEVLQALRAWDKNTPVIMCSAVDVGDEKKRCMIAGATQFITKPFELDDLTTLIEKLTEVSEAA